MLFKKSAEMAYTAREIKSPKWLLIASAACAAAVDLIIVAILGAGGVPAKFFAAPIVLLCTGVIFLVTVCFFTNFRFKYSLAVWIPHTVITLAVLGVSVALIMPSDETVLTNGALGLWVGVHAFSAICTVVLSLYASNVVRRLVAAIAFAAILLAGCVFYGAFMLTSGFFGQGAGVRPLIFILSEDGQSYTVSGILEGSGSSVIIPDSFNGKPVTGLDCSVFMEEGVESYRIHGDPEFLNAGVFGAVADLSGKSIETDADHVNSIRDKLYANAEGSSFKNCLALANCTLPTDLGGKNFVAFKYSEGAYKACGMHALPVFIGDTSKFDLTEYAGDNPFFTRRDKSSPEDLHWAYDNAGGVILSDVKYEGGSLFDAKITGDAVADVTVERVYKVFIGDGNDTKYPLNSRQPDFCFDKIGGSYVDFRYVSEGSADALLDGVEGRAGFTLSWTSDGHKLESLRSELVSSRDGMVIVNPVWALNAPKISITGSDADNRITYGDDVSFTASAAVEGVNGLTYYYNWAFNVNGRNYTRTGATLDLSHPTTDYAGAYYVTVTAADSGAITSLTSESTAATSLAINKKPLTVGWEITEHGGAVTAERNFEYNGYSRTVRATCASSQIVEGDGDSFGLEVVVRYPNGGGTSSNSDTLQFKDVSVYNFTAELNTAADKNYVISSGGTERVTVTPRSTEVQWSGYQGLIYNAQTQRPAATAAGVGEDASVVLTVSGATKKAGTHTATASTQNANYTLTNTTREFTIAKYEIAVNWTGYSGLIYNGALQCPKASCTGLSGDGNVIARTDGAQRNAGTGYVATAVLANDNYILTNPTFTFSIAAKQVTLNWSGNSGLVYSGSPVNVTASVVGAVAGDDVSATVTGGREVNAGSHTATATLAGADKGNYVLSGATSIEYKIEKGVPQLTLLVGGQSVPVVSDGVSLTDIEKGTAISWSAEVAVAVTVNGVQIVGGTYSIIQDCTIALQLQADANHKARTVTVTVTVAVVDAPEDDTGLID